MHRDASGYGEQQGIGCAQVRRHPRKYPGEGATADLLGEAQVDVECAGDVVTMDEQLGNGHSGPAAGISEATGMPGPLRAETRQQPGEHMRSGHRVVELLGWWRGAAVPQHGQAVIGVAGDLPGVEQQCVGDMRYRLRCRPLRGYSGL